MDVTHLLVDYGEVISYPQTQQDITDMADRAQMDRDTFARLYWQHRPGYDRGSTAAAYWSAVLGRDLNDPGSPASQTAADPALVEALVTLDMRSWTRLDPVVLRILTTNRPDGLRLSLLSNAPHELADAVSAHPAFADFDHLMFSARISLVKPDPAVFRAALDRIGAPAQEVLFIDDRAENVTAATSVGLQAYRYIDSDQLSHRLWW
jgi:putative hydrolase of the HAD superfamily